MFSAVVGGAIDLTYENVMGCTVRRDVIKPVYVMHSNKGAKIAQCLPRAKNGLCGRGVKSYWSGLKKHLESTEKQLEP